MPKYLGFLIPKEPFLAVYADKERTIDVKPVYGFIVVSDKEHNIKTVPVVYDKEHLLLYPESGGSCFLGVVPQDMFNELNESLREKAKEVLFKEGYFVSERSYIRAQIMRILTEMEKEYSNGEVPRADLVAHVAKELNMVGKEILIEREIRSLYESGRIYYPRPSYVKAVPRSW
jgi:hypothetical protein